MQHRCGRVRGVDCFSISPPHCPGAKEYAHPLPVCRKSRQKKIRYTCFEELLKTRGGGSHEELAGQGWNT